MALSADLARATRNRGEESYVATAGVTYYVGGLVGVNTATGKCVKFTDVATHKFLGLVCRPHPLTTYGISTIVDEVNVNTSGAILEHVSVATVAAITNVGTKVYATDDNTLTLVACANTKAVGVITRWYLTTYCDVRLFTPAEYLLE